MNTDDPRTPADSVSKDDPESPGVTPASPHGGTTSERSTWIASALGFFLDNRLVVGILTVLLVAGGLWAAPFRWDLGGLPRDPVPVDAIPDIGENQQIVFTEWPGRSPRDVEDQVTYPLTTALLGIPGVRTVRSFSMFGFSTIYVIFEEDVEFYWSRSRVLEKLAALPTGTVPPEANPMLGPDATALGQVFWYTLEGHAPDGTLVGGWDQHELRTIQDWTVRYALQSVPGVSEVASIGGFVREYQVDIEPEAMRAQGVNVGDVVQAVRRANLDVGARTMEINNVEYVVRGIGFIKNVKDLEQIVVRNVEHTPIRISDIASVTLGPEQRRGALDDEGAPAVGGVVVVRFGANPLEVIERVQAKIAQISPGLPRRTLEGGTVSQVKIVPFYDRTGLIEETLGTLSTALFQQILITMLVVLVLLRHLRSSLVISSLLPLGVLAAFIAMKQAGVDANIMALSGIAIAIGTMVDMGIILVENVVEHLNTAKPGENRALVVRRAAAEVAPAIITSTLTTVVGFLPIFALTASEGKLFTPLAYTKTFAMSGALVLALLVLPAACYLLLRPPAKKTEQPPRGARAILKKLFRGATLGDWIFLVAGVVAALTLSPALGLVVVVLAAVRLLGYVLPARVAGYLPDVGNAVVVVVVVVLLADDWMPLGMEQGTWTNRLFVASLIAGLLLLFVGFLRIYPALLRWALDHKLLALSVPAIIVMWGLTAWLGFQRTFGWLPQAVRTSSPVVAVAHALPGFGREFMPPFDEGSFLYMPTTMPHASLGEALSQLEQLDAAIASVPEVDRAVGKLGRVDSPLDPAPISMYETIVTLKPEYRLDADGQRTRFRFDEQAETFVLDRFGEPIPDPDGRPYRQWRKQIRTTNDVWEEIRQAATLPGLTSAPKLMPIAARIVMLQSGMRAPMGLKLQGPDLETLESAALQMEALLKQVPSIRAETVVADRVVGKPYIEIVIDRRAIARHGIALETVQDVIQTAIGGRTVTRTVEGRERYPVRVRFMREERDSIESIGQVYVPSPLGHQIPLEQLAKLRYVRGPQVIKSEDTFMTSYVVFDKLEDRAEVGVVEDAQAFLSARIASGELVLPAGVSYRFAGSYENQVRSEKRLMVLVPLAIALILILIYLQFRRSTTTLMVFSGAAVALSGGFCFLWLYAQPWFLDVTVFDQSMRTLFQVHPINMSVAVWVGFIALLGIATDDGVVISTYLRQRFTELPPSTRAEARQRTLEAGLRRVRPCLMTTATTILALLPVITSAGRGSDMMVPMAIPLFGGMAFELVTLFVVPILYCAREERSLKGKRAAAAHG